MTTSRNYGELLLALDRDDINEIIDELDLTKILTQENCAKIYEYKDNPEILAQIHNAYIEILSENILGSEDSEDDEADLPYLQKSNQEIAIEFQGIIDQIFLVAKIKEEEEKQAKVEAYEIFKRKAPEILNQLQTEANKYHKHLTTNIFGMSIKTGPKNKIAQVEALLDILNDKEKPALEIVEKARSTILEFKIEADQKKGLGTPRNPKWDEFINIMLSILLINLVRGALYGRFFQYPKGTKMIQNSFTIIDNYKNPMNPM